MFIVHGNFPNGCKFVHHQRCNNVQLTLLSESLRVSRDREALLHIYFSKIKFFFWIIEGKLARQPIQNIYAKTIKRSPFVNAWTTDDI